MLPTVEFDHELCLAAGEINDEGANKRLPPKMRAGQRNVMTKPLPEHALGIGRLCAHPAGKLSLAIGHRVGFNHIRHHLWTPTPDPSPQGGGEKRRRRTREILTQGSADLINPPRLLQSSSRLRRRLLRARGMRWSTGRC